MDCLGEEIRTEREAADCVKHRKDLSLKLNWSLAGTAYAKGKTNQKLRVIPTSSIELQNALTLSFLAFNKLKCLSHSTE